MFPYVLTCLDSTGCRFAPTGIQVAAHTSNGKVNTSIGLNTDSISCLHIGIDAEKATGKSA